MWKKFHKPEPKKSERKIINLKTFKTMKDLWRMDNERGYWIREGEREMNCDSFWTFVQCSEKVKRTINDFGAERKARKTQ